MSLRNDIELANTHAKLARLEARYAALSSETGGDQELRELTMESLVGTINQFKEEIARYQCGSRGANEAAHDGNGTRQLRNERELANTREKLRSLEEAYEETRSESSDDPVVRDVSRRSLKRLINQLKEEIARYDAHQPAQR